MKRSDRTWAWVTRGAAGRAAVPVLVLWLAGCASPIGVPAPSADSAGASASATAMPPSLSGVDRFEAVRKDQALLATRQGRLAEAALAWEVLALLRPGQAEYQQQWSAARQALEQAVTQRLARAQAARQRGDTSAAERLYLEVLSLSPAHASASQALRDLETERNRASVVGRFAQPFNLQARSGRGTTNAPATAPVPRGQTATPGAPPGTTNQRNLLEHASLLVSQGELDSAIALLNDAGSAVLRDPESRQTLARLYAQRGEFRAARDHKAARSDMERALELDPSLKEVRARLQALAR